MVSNSWTFSSKQTSLKKDQAGNKINLPEIIARWLETCCNGRMLSRPQISFLTWIPWPTRNYVRSTIHLYLRMLLPHQGMIYEDLQHGYTDHMSCLKQNYTKLSQSEESKL